MKIKLFRTKFMVQDADADYRARKFKRINAAISHMRDRVPLIQPDYEISFTEYMDWQIKIAYSLKLRVKNKTIMYCGQMFRTENPIKYPIRVTEEFNVGKT